MKTRREVAEFINSKKDRGNKKVKKHDTWHFGTVDLREIMDFIYDGHPENEDEYISKLHN